MHVARQNTRRHIYNHICVVPPVGCVVFFVFSRGMFLQIYPLTCTAPLPILRVQRFSNIHSVTVGLLLLCFVTITLTVTTSLCEEINSNLWHTKVHALPC